MKIAEHLAPLSLPVFRSGGTFNNSDEDRAGEIMNILVAIDDSKFSEAAANAVIAQAKTNNTEVRLLHVLEPFPTALAEKMGSKEVTLIFQVRV